MAQTLLKMVIVGLTVWRLSWKIAIFLVSLYVFLFMHSAWREIPGVFPLFYVQGETSQNKIFHSCHFVLKMAAMRFSTLQVLLVTTTSSNSFQTFHSYSYNFWQKLN